MEVVVVVDGHDPETVTALKAVGEPRVRVVALSEKVGGSEARNVGVREAHGEWIALLDDDDEWLPHKIERQVRAVQQSWASRTIIASKFVCREPGKLDRVAPLRLPSIGQPLSEYIFESFSGFQTSTFFCSRALIMEIPFRKGLIGLQDIDWFLQLMGKSNVKLIVIPEVLSIYNLPVGRDTVTTRLNWETRLEWACPHRNLMTRRGYSLFIIRYCVPRAAEQKAGSLAVLKLLWECAWRGSLTPRLLLLFFSRYLLSENTRHSIRAFMGLTRLDSQVWLPL